MRLSDGKIGGGQFTFKLTGTGEYEDVTGNGLGEFFGPAGQEIGAIFNAETSEEPGDVPAIMRGYIGAVKQ